MTSWLLVLCLVLWLLTEASELVMSCLLFKVSRKQKQTRKLQKKSFHVREFTVSVSTLSLSWYFVLFCNSVFLVPLVPLFPLCCVSPCPPSLCQSSCFSIFMFQHHISFHFFLFYFVCLSSRLDLLLLPVPVSLLCDCLLCHPRFHLLLITFSCALFPLLSLHRPSVFDPQLDIGFCSSFVTLFIYEIFLPLIK